MFIDHVKIRIASGSGGNGCINFLRAKYVPTGGPDGGDGGDGGDIVFVADTGRNTLSDFRFKKHFAAQNGAHGQHQNKAGKQGEDLLLKVPVGTIVRDAGTGRILADMTVPDLHRILARGGRGGRGNQHFATPSRQAPRYAEDGKPGKTLEIVLELKILADAGIIGFPNAGKSTLLAMVTNAKPKIADYQFTTLSPNLGVVQLYGVGDDAQRFVLADIPGLIEGASEGRGLGHSFLRHIERTKVLIHVVDASPFAEFDPVDAVRLINEELHAFNPELLNRPQILVANKMDLFYEAEERERIVSDLRNAVGDRDWPVFACSAATNDGLGDIMKAAGALLADYPEDIVFAEEEADAAPMPEEGMRELAFTVTVEEEGVFRVEGPAIDRLLGYTNLNDERGFAFFQRFLRERGILGELEAQGAREGDTVQMYEFAFDYIP